MVSFTMATRLRGEDKERILIPKMPVYSPNPMFDHLLESSSRDQVERV